MTTQGFNTNTRNNEIPFFPSYSYEIVEADKNKKFDRFTFQWVQAFFDSTFSGIPVVVVGNGVTDVDGDKTGSAIYFAYSGQLLPIKGIEILSTGVDVRGRSVNSSPIGTTLTTDITKLIVYGGVY